MAIEYRRKSTPLSESQTAEQLLAAWGRVHGGLPDRNTAELFLALLWNENSRGRAINNYNWGNVIAVGDQDFWRPPWYDLATVEAMPDGAMRTRYLALNKRMREKPGTVPTKFRAFTSHERGADRWLATLANPRYAGTRAAAEAGDALEFGRALHREGYVVDPGTDRLGAQYASLREDVRRGGWLAHLPLAERDSGQLVTYSQGWHLAAGYSYRVIEVSRLQPDWATLSLELSDAGATDVVHSDNGMNGRWSQWGDYVLAFTTPVLAIAVDNPNPMIGGIIVSVERVGADDAPPTTRRGGGGLMFALVAVGLLGALVAARRA